MTIIEACYINIHGRKSKLLKLQGGECYSKATTTLVEATINNILRLKWCDQRGRSKQQLIVSLVHLLKEKPFISK